MKSLQNRWLPGMLSARAINYSKARPGEQTQLLQQVALKQILLITGKLTAYQLPLVPS